MLPLAGRCQGGRLVEPAGSAGHSATRARLAARRMMMALLCGSASHRRGVNDRPRSGRGCQGAPGCAIDQARHQRPGRWQWRSSGNHFHIGGVGDIHGRDDRQALQVVGVVGDDQRVGAGLALMVLFGLISGRSIGTRLLALS